MKPEDQFAALMNSDLPQATAAYFFESLDYLIYLEGIDESKLLECHRKLLCNFTRAARRDLCAMWRILSESVHMHEKQQEQLWDELDRGDEYVSRMFYYLNFEPFYASSPEFVGEFRLGEVG